MESGSRSDGRPRHRHRFRLHVRAHFRAHSPDHSPDQSEGPGKGPGGIRRRRTRRRLALALAASIGFVLEPIVLVPVVAAVPIPARAALPGEALPGDALGPSSAAQIALADHLRRIGVRFYGAHWCQHCFQQKLLFGQQAAERLPYVECASEPQPVRACEQAAVEAYPTWILGRQRRLGVQSLRQLAIWSGYSRLSDFPGPRPAVP